MITRKLLVALKDPFCGGLEAERIRLIYFGKGFQFILKLQLVSLDLWFGQEPKLPSKFNIGQVEIWQIRVGSLRLSLSSRDLDFTALDCRDLENLNKFLSKSCDLNLVLESSNKIPYRSMEDFVSWSRIREASEIQ